MGRETSRMGGFVAIWMKVECEGWVGEKGVAEGVSGWDGEVKGIENVLGGKVGVCMDLSGIVLNTGSGSAEGMEMRSEGTPCAVTRAKVVFKVGGKREGTVKGTTVCTGTSGRGSRWEVVASAEGTAGMSTQKELRGGGVQWVGGRGRV